MNKYFKKADRLLRATKTTIEMVLGQDGEDISYYNPEMLDHSIDRIVEARSEMAKGRLIDDLAEEKKDANTKTE
jgi:hypothetical protein